MEKIKLDNHDTFLAPLSKTEEKDLIIRYIILKHVDIPDRDRIQEALRSKIVRHNLRFLAKMALRYSYATGRTAEDLYSEGKMGMLEALDAFDLSKNVKFISYAVWHIIKAFGVVTKDDKLIKHGVTKKSEKAKLEKTGKEEDPHSPLNYKFMSLDQEVAGTDDMTLQDVIPDEDAITDRATETRERDEHVRTIVEALPERDGLVLSLHFGLGGEDPMKVSDIARKLEISKERARQILERAMKTFKAKAIERGVV